MSKIKDNCKVRLTTKARSKYPNFPDAHEMTVIGDINDEGKVYCQYYDIKEKKCKEEYFDEKDLEIVKCPEDDEL